MLIRRPRRRTAETIRAATTNIAAAVTRTSFFRGSRFFIQFDGRMIQSVIPSGSNSSHCRSAPGVAFHRSNGVHSGGDVGTAVVQVIRGSTEASVSLAAAQ